VAEVNFGGLSDAVAIGEQWLVVSERERQEQFEELTLLQTRGSKLCLAIVGPPQVRNHLSNAGCCPPPYRDGPRACRGSSRAILYRGVNARALARGILPCGSCG
jgi:hypothetical protein